MPNPAIPAIVNDCQNARDGRAHHTHANITTPKLTKAPPNSAAVCSRLNELEFQQLDFVPRLGAWGLHAPDDLPGYGCFIPSAGPMDGFHMTLMWWCVRRAAWLRDRFWPMTGGGPALHES